MKETIDFNCNGRAGGEDHRLGVDVHLSIPCQCDFCSYPVFGKRHHRLLGRRPPVERCGGRRTEGIARPNPFHRFAIAIAGKPFP